MKSLKSDMPWYNGISHNYSYYFKMLHVREITCQLLVNFITMNLHLIFNNGHFKIFCHLQLLFYTDAFTNVLLHSMRRTSGSDIWGMCLAEEPIGQKYHPLSLGLWLNASGSVAHPGGMVKDYTRSSSPPTWQPNSKTSTLSIHLTAACTTLKTSKLN